jgi:hypothetical protein
MQGIQQIQSANYEAARQARAAYKARLLAEGKSTVCKLDAQGIVDIDIQPLAFESYDAAKGYLNKSVPLHLQKDYLISSPKA